MKQSSILIVEDEAIVALDLEAQLCDMGYHVCGIADTGPMAISLARQEHPDLVLMDIVLKGDMDGIDAGRNISRGMLIPVVFLTSFNDPATVERAAKISPYGYVTKPFQANELRAVIEVALYKAKLEVRLRESEQWFTSMLRCVGDGIVATDPDGSIRFMNPVAETLLGWSLDEVSGRNVDEVVVVKNRHNLPIVISPIRQALQEGKVIGIDFGHLLVTRDNRQVPVDNSAAPIRDENDRPLGAVMVFRDISLRLAAEESLRSSEEHFRHAFEFAPLGMALVGIDGRFLKVNAVLCALLRQTETELQGKTQQLVSHSDDLDTERTHLFQLLTGSELNVQYEKRYRGANGRDIWTLNSVSLLTRQEEPLCYLYQVHDLTERKEAEIKLIQLANFDSLTGLANRASLRQEADRLILSAKRQNKILAMLFLDLDRFKDVNDSLGHEAGDKLLQIVAAELKTCIRETDFVARLGGDEFVILLYGISTPEEVSVVTEKILQKFVQPIYLSGTEIFVGVCFGVSLFPFDGEETMQLLRCADSALYQAKSEGSNSVQYYRRELTTRVEEKLKTQTALRHALEHGEMQLFYQPIVALNNFSPIGAEALLRWNHPSRGLLTPDAFIDIAEESGLIVPIGEWVLAQACSDAARLGYHNAAAHNISVNVSARQFKSEHLISTVKHAMRQASLEPDRLCLEITEHLLLNDSEHNMELINELKSLGLRISIDDFGIGYSSLSYIKRFNPDIIKIDRSFVADLTENPDDAAIVRAIIAMAGSLQMKVVAEGVENEAQQNFLKGLHCDLVQGYLYSHPVPCNEWQAWLESKKTRH